jgi:dipeptidyl aminopeptidase/acylaminoacyl peptidase
VEKVTGEDGIERWEAEAEGNVELAANLQGKLMMIYGAQDDNVHPAHLFRMADALIKANKRFDMFMVPGAGHGLGDWRYLYGMIWDYFAEHLIGDPRPGVEGLVPTPAEK